VPSHRIVENLATSQALAELAALASAPGWLAGPDGIGHEKLPLDDAALRSAGRRLLAKSLAELGDPPDGWWDCQLLRSVPGAHVPSHHDPAEDGCVRLRLELIVAAPAAGGALLIDGEDVPLAIGDAVVFRADQAAHEVAPVERGTRLVWSVGANLPQGRYARPKREHGRRRKGNCCR
jgi:hypothetical protein